MFPTMHSAGRIVVNDFTQTGGNTSPQGDLTVNGHFSQGPNGAVTVQVHASGQSITLVDGQGGLTLGNIASGAGLNAASTGGNIVQAGGTVIQVSGDTVLSAPGASILQASSGNQFGGRVVLDGAGGGSGHGPGDVMPVVVPPVVAPPALPVPQTAPPAIDGSAMLALDTAAPASTVRAAAVGDGVSVRVLNPPSAQAQGLVVVEVPEAMLVTGFSFAVSELLAGSAPAIATHEDGSPLLGWLQFDAERRRFTATRVPASGLPLRVRITTGGLVLVLQIGAAPG